MGAWKVLTSVILVKYYNHLLPSALGHHSLCPEVANLLKQETFSIYKLTQNLEVTEWKNTWKFQRVTGLQALPRDLQNVLSQKQHTGTAKNADYGVSSTHKFLMLMHYFYA